MKYLLAAVGAALMLTCASAASAAGLLRFESNYQFIWTQSAAQTGGSLSGSGLGEAVFYRSAPGIPRELTETPMAIAFTVTAHLPDGNPASCCRPGGQLYQSGMIYDFAITYAGSEPLVIGDETYAAGANLLSGIGVSGNMTNQTALLPIGTRSGVLSSDLIDLSGFTASTVNFAFDHIVPAWTADAGESIHNFAAYDTRAVFYASVPEPGTWAMMIVGFGLTGLALRLRPTQTRRPLRSRQSFVARP